MTTVTDEVSLPAGWIVDRIGDLFDSWGGHTPSKANVSYWGPGLPWISSRDVKATRQTTSTHTVTLKAVEETGLRICPVGTVLVVVRSGILAHTLPVAVTEVPVTINQDLKAFYSEEPWLNEWLALFLRMSARELLASSRRDGTTVQSVQYPLLKSILMPVPPADEREQIIAAISRVLEKQSKIPEHLQIAEQSIRTLRTAVLMEACSGRLTSEWRSYSTLVPASVSLARKRDRDRLRLGEKYHQPKLPDPTSLPELPEEWCWAALPELGELGRGKSKHRPRNDPKLYGGDYPFIQTGDVARSNGYITSHTQTYNELGLAQSRLWAARTVCITIAANIAESGLLTYPACFPDSVVGLIADESIALPEYVELFIRTARRDLAAFAPATAQANINLAILSELAVPLPPIEEQQVIVSRASEILQKADELMRRISQALRQVDRSSQAVLAKAFRGELSTEAMLEAS